MSQSPARCIRCGSEDLADRSVEKLVRGGSHAVVLRVKATVCHRCGERFFDQATVEQLEVARKKLEQGELEDFRSVGQLLEPAAEAGA